jgi:hypothetical protein
MSLPSRTWFRDPCPLYFLVLSFLLPPRYMCLGFSFLSLHFMSFNSRTRFRDPCPLYFLVLYFPVAPRFAPWHLLICLCTLGCSPGPLLLLRTLLSVFTSVAPRFMRHGLTACFTLRASLSYCCDAGCRTYFCMCSSLSCCRTSRICFAHACILISVVCSFTCLRLSFNRGATPMPRESSFTLA